MQLKRSRIVAASLLAVIFTFSFFALTYYRTTSVYSYAFPIDGESRLLVFPVAFMMEANCQKDSVLLNQSTRMEIYNFVENNPGTHFRNVCEGLSLSVGVVQYHIGLLTSFGLVSVYRDGRYKRFFCSKKFGEKEMRVISALRRETAGKILSILLENQVISHMQLSSKLGITPQALTWEIKRLSSVGLIDPVPEGVKVRYMLDSEHAPIVREYHNHYGLKA